jgi:DNA-binding IclR family transcriptional regulator
VSSDGSFSNSAARAIAIVEFLAIRPTETFTVAEIARRVGLNKSTTYTLIRTLRRAGWAFRSPIDLRYGIGPTVIVLGEAAAQALPEVSFARPIMERLASDFGRECVLSTLVGDEIVVLASTGPSELGTLWNRPGSKSPCSPPFGSLFMAWQDPQQQKRWFERGTVVSVERFEELAADLELIKRRGFVATLKSTVEAQLAQVMRDIQTTTTLEDLRRIQANRMSLLTPDEYLVGSEDGVDSLSIRSLQAPIFDGEVVGYALTVASIDEVWDFERLREMGSKVRNAADEVSAAIGSLNRSRHPGALAVTSAPS